MKRLAYLTMLLSVAALLAFVPIAGAQQDSGVIAAPVQNMVAASIKDYYFDPADGVIPSGMTVLWTNEGNEQHTVTADDGSFDSGVLNPGDTFMVTFLGSGTMTYHCELHSGMTGSVAVGENTGGEATTADGSTPTEDTTGAAY